jgi:hypothetical protein
MSSWEAWGIFCWRCWSRRRRASRRNILVEILRRMHESLTELMIIIIGCLRFMLGAPLDLMEPD